MVSDVGLRWVTFATWLAFATVPRPAEAVSNLNFKGAQGVSKTYLGKPAAWNSYLPNFGKPKLSMSIPLDRESYNVQPSFHGRVVIDPAANGTRSLGCEPFAVAAPPGEAVALLLERGLCRFREKASNAYRAGYKGVVVANTVWGAARIPDMDASPDKNNVVEVPSWALSKEDGADLRAWLETDHSIMLEVMDVPRTDQLGYFQEDAQGLRRYYNY